MGQVSVPVNGRSFSISCDDGQEARIRGLAQYVDAKIGDFVGRVGQVGEARLLLLAALVIADELSDANDALEQERNRSQTADFARPPPADAAASGRYGMENRAEPIAVRLQTP
jgi:cell division protein ZapA